jgi:branched-chain amino acid aminotransferase
MPTPVNEPIVYVNGAFVPQSQATISVLDHAVLYGDGVFDTALAWNGRVFKLDAHVERSFRSMAAVAIPPPVDRAELKRLLLEAVRRNGLREAYLKWIVTRGANGAPLLDPTGCVPNLIIIARPYIHRAAPERIARGLTLKTVAVRRPSGQVLDPHIKSLNYLNLVMAKLEAKAAGADEALLLDLAGRVCEATGNNVFVVHGRELRTPRHDILRGVTRETVLELAAAQGWRAEEAELELYDAYTADEMFLCGTAGGLLPVATIDGRPVGAGRPGPVWRALSEAYQARIASGVDGTDAYAERPAPV